MLHNCGEVLHRVIIGCSGQKCELQQVTLGMELYLLYEHCQCKTGQSCQGHVFFHTKLEYFKILHSCKDLVV